jgi:hypothetical protein
MGMRLQGPLGCASGALCFDLDEDGPVLCTGLGSSAAAAGGGVNGRALGSSFDRIVAYTEVAWLTSCILIINTVAPDVGTEAFAGSSCRGQHWAAQSTAGHQPSLRLSFQAG